MARNDAVTFDEIVQIVALCSDGINQYQVSIELNRSPHTVERYWRLVQRAMGEPDGIATMLKDPTNTYRPGTTFETLEFITSIDTQSWPSGSVWAWRNGSFRIVEIEYQVRASDGALLRTEKGGKYEWEHCHRNGLR